MYPTKISLVVLDSLATWEKLNVASFLASAIAIAHPETHGRTFTDAAGSSFLPFIRQPAHIYAAERPEVLQRVCRRAREADLPVGIFPRGLLATKTESDNHTVIAQRGVEDQELVGVVVYGPRAQVDRAFKRLKLHE